MVTFRFRYSGQSVWNSLTLPVTPQVAHTLRKIAATLQFGDENRIINPDGRVNLRI